MFIYAIKISNLRDISERLDGDFENIFVQQPVTKISFTLVVIKKFSIEIISAPL